jgi:hypothetical protein
MATRITLNSAGMKALLNSGEVRAMLTGHAEGVLAAAQADPHDDSGDYERSLHIEQATTDRAVVRVVADVPYSHVLEANYGILARALDSA